MLSFPPAHSTPTTEASAPRTIRPYRSPPVKGEASGASEPVVKEPRIVRGWRLTTSLEVPESAGRWGPSVLRQVRAHLLQLSRSEALDSRRHDQVR